MMMITVLKILFTPTIIVVGFTTNIPPRCTPNSQINEFNNYSISLLEFHIECVIKVVYMKIEEERVTKKLLFCTIVLNNVCFGVIYRQLINTSLDNRNLILTITTFHDEPSPLFMSTFTSYHNQYSHLFMTNNHLFLR